MPVDYHAWTHRPKALGGTDPIESDLKFIVCKDIITGQTFAPGTSDVLWQENVNEFPECFEPLNTEFSPDYNQIRLHEDGFYTASVNLFLSSTFNHDWQLGIYTVDAGTPGPQSHRSVHGYFDASMGFFDASFSWSFRMDGTGGSNRKIEFQFFNFHATEDIESHSSGGCYIEVYKWPFPVAMDGRDRSAS